MDVVAPTHAPSPGPNGVGSSPFAAIDPERVIDYLGFALEAALGATEEELSGSLLSPARYSDTVQRCTRFANDTLAALYIQKDIAASPPIEDGADDSSQNTRLPRTCCPTCASAD